jgi:GrpB-like predicted nucleotidyltransferase (UPF0157 family)
MITITSYQEDWPKRFGEIRDVLQSELVGNEGDLRVENFGSTAVPGLVARPILDLCVRLARLLGPSRPLGICVRAGSACPWAGDLSSKGAGRAISRTQEGFLAPSPVRLRRGFLGTGSTPRFS